MKRTITLIVGALLFALVAGATDVPKFETFLGYTYARTNLGSDPAVIVSRANDQALSASISVMAASGSMCRARFPPSLNTSLGGLAQSGRILDTVSTGASTRGLPQSPTRVQEK